MKIVPKETRPGMLQITKNMLFHKVLGTFEGKRLVEYMILCVAYGNTHGNHEKHYFPAVFDVSRMCLICFPN